MKKVFYIYYFVVFPFLSFSQEKKNAVDCENYGIGATIYNAQFLNATMKIIQKDIIHNSVYGNFDNSLMILTEKMKKHHIISDKINIIIQDIKKTAKNSDEKIEEHNKIPFKSLNTISLFPKKAYFTPLSINYFIEKHLTEEEATKLLNELLEDSINASHSVSFLEKQFCAYQKLGMINEKYTDVYHFLKDYFSKNISN